LGIRRISTFPKFYRNSKTEGFDRRQAFRTIPTAPSRSVAAVAVSAMATATAAFLFAVRAEPQCGEVLVIWAMVQKKGRS